ncbi:hypothetical protein [Sphingomonas baiyangensis]|uniref:Uncharacterized protein n=1 Tax=Sphingomonas baiyangensis TaxID=2572576 RepID=A0A4U1L4L5_9SPHN|nr:hypothetical protein [Sphingomonas baiyangensis]TKD51877.1 hypothetical protein FBR43_14845 [Sphingomonas baiyangensis]
MPRPAARSVPQRSPRAWAGRGALAALALVCGYVSTTQSLGAAIGKSAAERAHALAPGDGRIAAELAEQLAAGDPDPASRARADALARSALAAEPLAAPALTALALNAQVRGDTGTTRRLFAHSNRLSRRELGARLWMIEDAVARNDIPGALRHYDIALRTSRAAPDLLFPVLSAAIADPTVAAAVADTLAARPPWGGNFIEYAAALGADPVATTAFIDRLTRRDLPVPAAARVSAVNALVNAGRSDLAWASYARLRGDVARDRSRDPQFAAQLASPTVFDWVAINNDAGVYAAIQPTEDGGIVDFAVPATVSGIVLQQAQLLPPGRYALAGASAGIDQLSDARPYWQLVCTDGRELGRVELPNSSANDGRFAGGFTVDAACPAQMLRLVARASTAVGGVTGQITRAALTPAGPRAE